MRARSCKIWKLRNFFFENSILIQNFSCGCCRASKFSFHILFDSNENWDKFLCKKLNGFHVDGDDDADRQTSTRENLGRPARICRKENLKHVKQWKISSLLCFTILKMEMKWWKWKQVTRFYELTSTRILCWSHFFHYKFRLENFATFRKYQIYRQKKLKNFLTDDAAQQQNSDGFF